MISEILKALKDKKAYASFKGGVFYVQYITGINQYYITNGLISIWFDSYEYSEIENKIRFYLDMDYIGSLNLEHFKEGE